jgi:prepilin-type N-terminal cleavage/methylation domain-containing protein
MKRRPSAARAGFTLAEVLASMVLIGLVIPAALAGISLAIRLGEAAQDQTHASMLGSGKLDELLATGEWQDGDAEGDFGDEWPDYGWSMTVYDWEEPAVSQIDVVVEWTRRGKERFVTFTGLAYREAE